MLIECPACKVRANLPDSHEGSKVRCGECGRVYVASPAGAARRSGRSSSNSGLYIGLGVAGVALIIVLAISQRGGKETKAVEAPPEVEEVYVDRTGWDSELVKAAVQLHTAAYTLDEGRLQNCLHIERTWIDRQVRGGTEPAAASEAFLLLAQSDVDAFVRELIVELTTGEAKDLVADWKPYDGSVISEEDEIAIVRLQVSPVDPARGAEKRNVEWLMAKQGTRWKAYHWERWFSPEELKSERRRRGKGYDVKTLSDGSVVHEREPEPLGHLDDTPPELRARIDELYATMIDLDLTKESSRAMMELIEIGRPAIPILLTGMFEIQLDTEEHAIQVNLIDQCLRTITGFSTGFKPMVAEGSAAGTTQERRDSSIKQWFAWWHRKKNKFQEAEKVDALEGMIDLPEKEKKWLERNQ
jgi:hypothetical protein